LSPSQKARIHMLRYSICNKHKLLNLGLNIVLTASSLLSIPAAVLALQDNPPPPTYTINPAKIQTGTAKRVTITTDTGDLSKAEPQAPPAGSGVTFEPISGQNFLRSGTKTIYVDVKVAEDADLGTVPITLIQKGENDAVTVLGVVNLEIVEFKPRKISRGPTPDDIDFEVDAMWNVLPYKVVKANFGRRAADSFYAVEVFLGNNSGFDLQIVGVGFESTLGAPLALDKNGKPLQPIYDANGKPILDDRGNKLIPDLDANGNQKTGPDGKPLYKPYRSYHLPTSDHRLVRGSIEMDQLYGSRAFTLNLIGGLGTLVSGFIPFFHRPNPKANFSSFSSVLNGQFKEGFGIAAPDLTVSQLNRLENLVLHDGLTVLNNSQAKTIVFFPRHVVALSDDERKIIDRGESMWPLIDKLGELIIVGKPIITYRNREIVATRPQPTTPPATPGATTIGPPAVNGISTPTGNAPGSGKIIITGANFVPSSQVTLGNRPVPASKVTYISPAEIDVVVPEDAVSGRVKVTTPSGSSNESPTDFIAQPRIKSINPKNAVPGTAITIEGENLDTATSVNFGSVAQAQFLSKDKNKIIVNVPEKAESAIRVVTSVGDAPLPSTEKFIAQPVLDPLTTKRGKTDDRITITGKNLDNAEIFFGNARAEVVNPGSTSIEVKVPENAVSGPITVRTAPGVEKKTEDFTFFPKPEISLISVDGGAAAETVSGKAGATVTITGRNLKLKEGTDVTFNGAHITPTENTDAQITFIVPADAAAGKATIEFETPGGKAKTDKVTVIPKPTVTGISVGGGAPAETGSGAVGATVKIVGTNLDRAQVKFGNVPATVTNNTATEITVTVPAGATTGRIKVITLGGEAETGTFTVQ
jgi:hypothetical protein